MAAQLFAGLTFGAIGFVALVYGKKQSQFKTMLLGVGLMVYPYFVASPVLLWGIGVALTACLWLFRD